MNRVNRFGRRRGWLVAVLMVVGMTLLGAVTVLAQQGIPTPITIGENRTGEFATPGEAPSYSLTVPSPQSVTIQVLAISNGFVPVFRVIDPTGVVVHTAANPTNTNIVQANAILAAAGTYRIEVQSVNGTLGEFVISVQGGAPLQPPQPLQVGQSSTGTVSASLPREAYTFTGSATEVLLLSITSSIPLSGPTVTVRDADTNEALGVSSARLAGVRYRIPVGLTSNYLVEVTHSGSPVSEAYAICVQAETAASPCPTGVQAATAPTAVPTVLSSVTPVATLALPTLPPTGPCVVASATGGNVNVRSGPGTEYNVVTTLGGLTTAAVVGRLPNGSWYQINANGFSGWISGTVVRVGGQCGLVPALTLTPTLGAPTATGTLAAPTATFTATIGPTATHTLTPTIVPTLNFSSPPNYGSTALTSGFVPDPFTVGMTSGGSVDVSYLGGGCTGFATSAPDFSVNYTSGAFPTLRFYFIGSGDTTLIINSPSGSYSCVDDSFGTLNPTIDFNTPSGGRYDIWIGSFQQGTSISGTLYVTENTGNHP